MKNNDSMQNFNFRKAGADRLSLISKISWQYKKGFNLRGERYGLAANEVALLSMLYWYPELDTANMLRRELGITKGMISRYVDSLLKKGLLKAETDEKDKRVIRLSLSEEAVTICKEVTQWGGQIVDGVFSKIEPESVMLMVETLDRIYSNLGDLSET